MKYQDLSVVKQTLSELALLFLKLGTLSFGGPAAHIAMMEDEVVRRRKWMSRDEFLDLLGATNLIPGPNSTELAIHIGHKMAGWPGLFVAGLSFIFPALLMVWFLAWAYVRFGALPQIQGILYAVKPVIIAIVLQALYRLGRTALKTKTLLCLLLLAVIVSALGVNELLVLFASGLFMLLFQELKGGATKLRQLNLFIFPFLASSKLTQLFLIFLKIGSVLFGSGYVLLAFLQNDFVDHRHWLSQSQLFDAIAVGQLTPGPVFTTATFVGYLMAGHAGAFWASVGIFLPAFFFVALSSSILARLRKSKLAGAFLDGVNVASLALMLLVTWQLGRTALLDFQTVLIALGSLILLYLFRLNSAWLVLGAGIWGVFKGLSF